MLYWPLPNALYVEGYALDRFAEGLWALQPVHQNRVSVFYFNFFFIYFFIYFKIVVKSFVLG